MCSENLWFEKISFKFKMLTFLISVTFSLSFFLYSFHPWCLPSFYYSLNSTELRACFGSAVRYPCLLANWNSLPTSKTLESSNLSIEVVCYIQGGDSLPLDEANACGRMMDNITRIYYTQPLLLRWWLAWDNQGETYINFQRWNNECY